MSGQQDRLYYMDAMRAILMMLGVVLHSAQIYNPAQYWLILSDKHSPVFGFLVDTIVVFRMPAFFIVSGYFCFLTLTKYQARKFVSVRLKRLVLPFLATALTLCSLQSWYLDLQGWREFDFADYLLNGGYVSHLWFLSDLMIYFVAAGFVYAYLKPVARIFKSTIEYILRRVHMLVIVFLMPLVSVFILALNKVGFPLYASFFGVFKMNSIMLYLPYFAFGIVLAFRKEYLARFCEINPLVIFFAALAASYSVGYIGKPQDQEMLQSVLLYYLQFLSRWLVVVLCFYFFYRFFSKKSRLMLFLSDASYTVYLFHHVLVVILGGTLVYLNIPAEPSFVLLVSLVLIITLQIHSRFVSRNPFLRMAFNGK